MYIYKKIYIIYTYTYRSIDVFQVEKDNKEHVDRQKDSKKLEWLDWCVDFLRVRACALFSSGMITTLLFNRLRTCGRTPSIPAIRETPLKSRGFGRWCSRWYRRTWRVFCSLLLALRKCRWKGSRRSEAWTDPRSASGNPISVIISQHATDLHDHLDIVTPKITLNFPFTCYLANFAFTRTMTLVISW